MSRSKRVDRTESSKEPDPVPSTSGLSGTAAGRPSPTADAPSPPAPPTFFLLRSVTLLAWSLDATPYTPAVVLYYYVFQGTVRLKMFLVFVSLYIICMQSIITLLQDGQFC